MGDDGFEVEVYYVSEGAAYETIRLKHGRLLEGEFNDLDIRDALFLQWQLAGAIEDYTKAVGK